LSLKKWFFTVLKNKKRPMRKVVGPSGRGAQPPFRQWIYAPQPLLGLNRADDFAPPLGFAKPPQNANTVSTQREPAGLGDAIW
jgi:hypothetical protein